MAHVSLDSTKSVAAAIADYVDACLVVAAQGERIMDIVNSITVGGAAKGNLESTDYGIPVNIGNPGATGATVYDALHDGCWLHTNGLTQAHLTIRDIDQG